MVIFSGTSIEETQDQVTNKRTIVRKLLEDTVNGDKIVEKQLDKNVATTHPNKNSVDYSVEIDFEGIICKDSPIQTHVVNDIL